MRIRIIMTNGSTAVTSVLTHESKIDGSEVVYDLSRKFVKRAGYERSLADVHLIAIDLEAKPEMVIEFAFDPYNVNAEDRLPDETDDHMGFCMALNERLAIAERVRDDLRKQFAPLARLLDPAQPKCTCPPDSLDGHEVGCPMYVLMDDDEDDDDFIPAGSEVRFLNARAGHDVRELTGTIIHVDSTPPDGRYVYTIATGVTQQAKYLVEATDVVAVLNVPTFTDTEKEGN